MFRLVLAICQNDKENGGLGIDESSGSFLQNQIECDKVVFLIDAWLEALNSQERAKRLPAPSMTRDPQRRPMTLSEKILAHHATSVPSHVGIKSGDMVNISIDWILASELSWVVRDISSAVMELSDS